MTVTVALMFIVAGAVSGNPYSSIGMSRSIIMMLAYEIPVLASLIIVAVKAGLTLSLFNIIIIQVEAGAPLAFIYPSIILTAAVFLFCMPAAAEAQPFDIPAAKTEIIHGVLTEYTGLYLALFKLAKANHIMFLNILTVLLFFYPAIIPLQLDWLALIIILILSLVIRFLTVTIPRAVFARVKITQALKLYWLISGILLTASIILLGLGV
jgi:formate hydrogenlyase subunit 4